MIEEIEKLEKLLQHLKLLFEIFKDEKAYKKVENILKEINYEFDYITTLYKQGEREGKLKERQLVLSDIIEFIIFGRLAYYMQKQRIESRKKFIKFLLKLINLLMEIDSLTVDKGKRKEFINKLLDKNLFFSNRDKEDIEKLSRKEGIVGIPDSNNELNKIYDSLLPKTAGGLWHELGVYAFMLRLDLGYIFPLLIHQRIFSLSDYLVVPDFLLLAYDKRFYGVEVGNKKEIQSGLFSAKTALPTITIDTNSSRLSDRCPICKKWIQICPYAIEKFLDDEALNLIKEGNYEIKCSESCNLFDKEEILEGRCSYAKYKQDKGKGENLYNTHDYADGKHYHFRCVLQKLKQAGNTKVIEDIKIRPRL